jgi:hypothetical protein
MLRYEKLHVCVRCVIVHSSIREKQFFFVKLSRLVFTLMCVNWKINYAFSCMRAWLYIWFVWIDECIFTHAYMQFLIFKVFCLVMMQDWAVYSSGSTLTSYQGHLVVWKSSLHITQIIMIFKKVSTSYLHTFYGLKSQLFRINHFISTQKIII